MALNNGRTVAKANGPTMRVRVGRKGTITLPKEVREMLGIREGATLRLEVRGGSIVLTPDDLWARLKARMGRLEVDEVEKLLDEEG